MKSENEDDDECYISQHDEIDMCKSCYGEIISGRSHTCSKNEKNLCRDDLELDCQEQVYQEREGGEQQNANFVIEEHKDESSKENQSMVKPE